MPIVETDGPKTTSQLEGKLQLTARVMEAASAILGLVLPTAALVNLKGLPGDLSAMAYVLLPTVSLAVVLAIIIRGSEIGRLSPKAAARVTLALAAAGALSTATYASFSDRLVISLVEIADDGERISEFHVEPLSPSGEIQAILRDYGGDYVIALTDEGPQTAQLKRLMFRDRDGTVVLLLGTLLLAQLLFVGAIVGGAWWLAEHNIGREDSTAD